MTNLIDFKTQVNKKDLEAFTQALLETTTKLQVENEQLKEQVKHLETLLMNVKVPIIGFPKDHIFDPSSIINGLTKKNTSVQDHNINPLIGPKKKQSSTLSDIRTKAILYSDEYELYGYYMGHEYLVSEINTLNNTTLLKREDTMTSCWVNNECLEQDLDEQDEYDRESFYEQYEK